eukprot:TRINITY_DN11697_c0_g1_i1.p1 TRINITY_DN11697_c0_g1~~TRINITY_DN11697_c0_g1_i1.p1  ORF type:complete len:144 (+),score=11.95 TRINITY_DN11697_c0_g1_i1:148-579(+)
MRRRQSMRGTVDRHCAGRRNPSRERFDIALVEGRTVGTADQQSRTCDPIGDSARISRQRIVELQGERRRIVQSHGAEVQRALVPSSRTANGINEQLESIARSTCGDEFHRTLPKLVLPGAGFLDAPARIDQREARDQLRVSDR